MYSSSKSSNIKSHNHQNLHLRSLLSGECLQGTEIRQFQLQRLQHTGLSQYNLFLLCTSTILNYKNRNSKNKGLLTYGQTSPVYKSISCFVKQSYPSVLFIFITHKEKMSLLYDYTVRKQCVNTVTSSSQSIIPNYIE